MPSSSSPSTGAVKEPVCSRAAEHSKQAAILTKQEAAALLRCTVRYIERQIKAGRLRACKPTGKLVRILREDINKFLASGASIAA